MFELKNVKRSSEIDIISIFQVKRNFLLFRLLQTIVIIALVHTYCVCVRARAYNLQCLSVLCLYAARHYRLIENRKKYICMYICI